VVARLPIDEPSAKDIHCLSTGIKINMSEGIIIAIIGFAGTILGALIGAFANIQVAKITALNPKDNSGKDAHHLSL
jgi:hypothetical protein